MQWSRYNRLFRSERFGWFLYNALSNTLLELDEAHYFVIDGLRRDCVNNFGAVVDSGFLTMLLMNKILVEEGEEERLLLARQYRRLAHCFDTTRLGLTICPTLACNFRCPYCFEQSQQDGEIMSSETVASLLAFIKNFSEIHRLSVTWFGGEPTLAFQVIRDITKKIKALDLDFVGANLVTNGYLLDRSKIAQLNDLKINSIQITLDGPQEVHDRRRFLSGGKPTFQRIMDNVATLMDSPYAGKCAIRVNVDKQNLDRFQELRAELMERFKGRKFTVYAAPVNSGPGQACDHSCSLNLQEWANFTFDMRKNGLRSPRSFHPADNQDSVCVATAHNGFVVGPKGELYKCWEDVGKKAMVIGNIHEQEPVTNPELRAQYGPGTDAYNDPVCRACDVLPICGGGCAHKRLLAKQFGEEGLEFCSPFRDSLIPCLEAYYDTFRSKEICAALFSPGVEKQVDTGYRIVSPMKTP